MQPKRSKLLDQVYGEEIAMQAYDQYQKMCPQYNVFAQEIAYDTFWNLSGLTLMEKMLTTIVSAIILGKAAEGALKYFFFGFFNLGGNPVYAENLVKYLHEHAYISSATYVLASLKIATDMRKEPFTKNAPTTLTPADKAQADLAACVSAGDPEKIRACLQILLQNNLIPINKIEAILLHLMTYCGFIYVGYALACLRDLQTKR
jgi:alkylhydroperoxidase/carboxymuconolactone decarboxylase family protein YurZ